MFARQGRFARGGFDVQLDLGEGLDWADYRTIRRHYPRVKLWDRFDRL